MDLRWAIDEALDGVEGRTIASVGVPQASWSAFTASIGEPAAPEVADYRGVRFQKTAGPELDVRFRALDQAAAPGERTALQTIAWPDRARDRPLYYRVQGAVAHERDALRLGEGAAVSFDTFFNSFFETYWTRYTRIRAVSLSLDGCGDIRCSVWRSAPDGERRRLLELDLSLSHGVPVSLPIALAESDDPAEGRLHLEVAARGEARLTGAAWNAVQPPQRTVSIGVGVCAFNREAQLEGLLASLLQPAAGPVAAVTVVNQGGPFTRSGIGALQAEDPRLTVIAQANHGGSGGFARAAMELLAGGGITHILFVDDDVELEPARLATAATFLAYATEPMVLGGHMLDQHQRTRLFDGGGRVFGGAIEANNRKLDLEDPASLDALGRIAPCDFNGWWMAIIPVEAFGAHGLPLPFFIHVDDVEFGVRLTEAGLPTIAPPSVAVWHEPYTAKPPSWFGYYDVRNWLIFASLYPHRYGLERVPTLLKRAVSLAIRYDHHQAAFLAAGLRDFVKGPSGLEDGAPAIQSRIRAAVDPHMPEVLAGGGAQAAVEDAPTGGWRRRSRLLSNLGRALFGTPRPNAAGDDCALAVDAPIDLMSLGARYVQRDADGIFALRRQHDGGEARRRFAELLFAIALYGFGARRAAGRWRAAQSALASPEAWRARFGL